VAFVGEAQPAVRWLPVEGGMNAMRWARRSAWLLWAVTLVVAAAGLALLVWDWSTPVPAGFFGIRGFVGVFAVCFGGVGALLTWRHPGHPVGWILAATGLVSAVDFASIEYGLAASAGRGHLPAAGYAGWVQLWIWVPLVALITVYLFLLLPDGHLPSHRPAALVLPLHPALGQAAGDRPAARLPQPGNHKMTDQHHLRPTPAGPGADDGSQRRLRAADGLHQVAAQRLLALWPAKDRRRKHFGAAEPGNKHAATNTAGRSPESAESSAWFCRMLIHHPA
jgi:hypothetical protein